MTIKKSATALLIFTFLLFNYNLYAQNQGRGGVIKGKALDSETNAPLARANVSILASKDSSVVTGGITDAKGEFEIENVRPGDYIVRVNYVGYSPYFSSLVSISRENRNVNLETIKLRQSSSVTDAVEVTAERQMIEYTQGKKVFNVDKNIASAGGTAIDVLKNIPSVNVDVDGNVSIRGSSNFKVLINGKPTTMNPTVLMEQMPAASIESIEIITNPSARYDAEGMSGIINLVLQQNREQGLNGLASINVGTGDKYSFALNTAYQFSDWNVFFNYDFGSRRHQATGNSYRETRFQDSSVVLEQDIRRRRGSINHSVRTGFDYQMSPLDQLSMSFSFRASDGERWGNVSSLNYFKDDNSVINDYSRISNEIDKGPNYDYSLNYKRNFGSKGHDLTFDFSLSQREDDETNDYEQFWVTPIRTSPFEMSSNYDISKNLNLQTDYVLPMGDYKFESGAKLAFQSMDDDYRYLYADSLGNMIDDVNKTNRFIYNERVIAAYAIFSGKLMNFSYQFGLRTEHTKVDTELRTTDTKNTKDYFGLFPSASLSYKISTMDEIQINYSRRINRPRSRFINPFTDYSDPNTLRTGNPDLDAESIDAYEVGYIKSFKGFSITPNLFYRKTHDKISFITEIVSNGVLRTTFENVAEGTNYGLELNASVDYFKWMRFSTDLSYYRSEIKGAKKSLELDNNDYSWSLRANANIMLSRELSFQLIGNYSGPTITPQGSRYEVYFMDFGARYDIWDRKMTLTFRLSDVFNNMYFGGTAANSNFDTRYKMKRESRLAFFGIQYKINEGPKQRERRRQQQENGGMEFEEF